MEPWILLLSVAVVPVIAIVGMVKLVRAFNSPDGERYRRMRMQGPFVPLSAEDIAEDERRIANRGGAGRVP